jgi:hypothetical protein
MSPGDDMRFQAYWPSLPAKEEPGSKHVFFSAGKLLKIDLFRLFGILNDVE